MFRLMVCPILTIFDISLGFGACAAPALGFCSGTISHSVFSHIVDGVSNDFLAQRKLQRS